MTFGECLGLVAPYYNLVIVIIVILLFIWLFVVPKKKAGLLPWYLLFSAIIIFIVEQIVTIIRLGGAPIPLFINGIFEMVIISIFIYTLLIKKGQLIKGTKK